MAIWASSNSTPAMRAASGIMALVIFCASAAGSGAGGVLGASGFSGAAGACFFCCAIPQREAGESVLARPRREKNVRKLRRSKFVLDMEVGGIIDAHNAGGATSIRAIRQRKERGPEGKTPCLLLFMAAVRKAQRRGLQSATC